MSRVESVGDLDAQIEHPVDLQRLATNAVLQRHAFQILHRYKWLTILLPDFVDSADVRYGSEQTQHVLRGESVPKPLVLGQVVWKKLQGDEAPKLDVLGFVNNTHPPPPSFSTMR